MDMSPACTMPTYDRGTNSDRTHPRWADYQRYQSAMVRQMVQGASFASWLRQTEEYENGHLVVWEHAGQHRGWFVNEFRPRTRCPYTHGPFKTREAAEAFRP